MEPLIELKDLQVQFGPRVILKKLNGGFRGRAIGLLGPNGAGKSTLINTLLGFVQPSGGTARILGHDVRSQPRQVRALIGYMPENDSFIANMTAVRFVRLMAELSGLPPDQAMERAHEACFYVGLGEVRYRNLGTYSTGMKQMVKLAQAIAHGPKVLFLDEPTNGLDPPARQRMIQLIREIRDTETMHLVISSHLLRDIEETCGQVLILKDGEIAAFCDLEEERRTNRKFLELETRGANGTFQEAIEKLGCEAAWSAHGRAKLILPDGVEIREIYAIATSQNVQLVRLNFKRDSLEEIFLQAVSSPGGRMAVYKKTYRAYDGPSTPEWSRFLILSRYSFEEMRQKRFFGLFLIATAIWPIVCAFIIYLHHNLSALKILEIDPSKIIAIDGNFFLFYLGFQSMLAFFLTAFIGPGLVSPDLANNALPLYLSRPFSRTEYVLGRISVLLVLLSVFTWIPGLLLFLFQGYLEGASWIGSNLRIAAGIFVGSWIWILILSLLALAFSAWVKWKPLAGAMLFLTFFLGSGLANAANGILDMKWGHLVNLSHLIGTVWLSLFGLEPTVGAGAVFFRVQPGGETPLWAAWAALAGFCCVCLRLLSKRIRGLEIVQ